MIIKKYTNNPKENKTAGGDSQVRRFGLGYVEITDYRKVKEKLQFLL